MRGFICWILKFHKKNFEYLSGIIKALCTNNNI